MQLPVALRPWATILALFPEEVAVGLGAMVRRLSSALGDDRAVTAPGDGDPDGFGGIAARGPYDRLLLSEWALCDELPDEFARRAASGELSFLEINRRRLTTSAAVVALVDSGPEQLGAPRLAHLAMLVLLARSAAARTADFNWGVLQADAPILSDLSPAGIDAFIAARTCMPPTTESVERWQTEIHRRDAQLWVIGGRQALAVARDLGSRLILVEEVLESEPRCLELQIRRADRAPRSITLELPNDGIATRLLRDPFARDPFTPAPPARLDEQKHRDREQRRGLVPEAGLVFSPLADKLFARTADGGVLELRPMARQPQKPIYIASPAEAPVVAVGRYQRHTIVVSASAGVVTVAELNRWRQPFRTARINVAEFAAETSCALGPAIVAYPPRALTHGRPESLELFFTDARKCLLRLDWNTLVVRDNLMHPVRGIVLHAERLVALGPAGTSWDGLNFLREGKLGASESHSREDAVFGFAGLGQRPYIAAPAVPGMWVVSSPEFGPTFHPPSKTRLIGLVRVDPFGSQVGMLCIEADDRTISLVAKDRNQELHRATVDIVATTMATGAALMAYTTRADTAVVVDLRKRKVLREFSRTGSV